MGGGLNSPQNRLCGGSIPKPWTAEDTRGRSHKCGCDSMAPRPARPLLGHRKKRRLVMKHNADTNQSRESPASSTIQ